MKHPIEKPSKARRPRRQLSVEFKARAVRLVLDEGDFTASGPNQRWVGDFTYLRTPMGFLYLPSIIDQYFRKVGGWAASAVKDRRVGLRALDMAAPGMRLVHDSDRDGTYAWEDYHDALMALAVTCSMNRSGNCLDKASMESWLAPSGVAVRGLRGPW